MSFQRRNPGPDGCAIGPPRPWREISGRAAILRPEVRASGRTGRMRLLVTGSSGHLGEALVRRFRSDGHAVVGLDLLGSPFTDVVGSVADRAVVAAAVQGVDAVVHSATLHKPHVVSHETRAFIDTNVSGTATLLEAAVEAGLGSFVFISTTSVFGMALTPASDGPAAWITEEVTPVPRNIYGVTKAAAEDLCQLAHQDRGLACVVLRVSRFFPEDDDNDATRDRYGSENSKVNELLFRRVDLADAVSACQAAINQAPRIGFGRYVISATTPFDQADIFDLRQDAPGVVRRYFPDFEAVYARRGWRMFPSLDRVYVNTGARRALGWEPTYDFAWALQRLREDKHPVSDLARAVGRKGYHAEPTGVYTTG
jgi:nucleoside-diphosphate-sugar epimerase